MKRWLMILLLALIPLQAEDNSTQADFSAGAMAGSMGLGVYFRNYLDESYLQTTLLFTYASQETTYRGAIIYGHYLYKDQVQAVCSIPYAIKIVASINGGQILSTTNSSADIVTALGLGFEFFNPASKGIVVEFSIDYAAIFRTDSYVGILGTGSIGYNF